MTPEPGAGASSEADSPFREVSVLEVKAMMDRGEHAVYLDVREPNEFTLGRLPGALHIPKGDLELKIGDAVPREANVIAYCSAGIRSAVAAETLQAMGYTNVASLAGGFREWMFSGFPVEE